MTDKQIIIDGVDVSGCECIIEDYQRANNFEGRYEHIKNVCELGERGAEYYNLFCKDNPNCYYKQLKRKEQELKNICKAFDIEYATDEETGNLIGRCNKLYKKEQECEELTADTVYLRDRVGKLERAILRRNAQLDQLKQTLDEIEEFCIVYSSNHDAYENVYKHILEIINEAKDGE